ncbi:unnamed protein product, partial [Phaeothamnion confervicola]
GKNATAGEAAAGTAPLPPEIESAFSQARNGRVKRLEETLNLGLPVDSTDEWGNTLLAVACQQCHRSLAEMLLRRGADPNRQNYKGNAPL